mgnify:CR=1 FL=1
MPGESSVDQDRVREWIQEYAARAGLVVESIGSGLTLRVQAGGSLRALVQFQTEGSKRRGLVLQFGHLRKSEAIKEAVEALANDLGAIFSTNERDFPSISTERLMDADARLRFEVGMDRFLGVVRK